MPAKTIQPSPELRAEGALMASSSARAGGAASPGPGECRLGGPGGAGRGDVPRVGAAAAAEHVTFGSRARSAACSRAELGGVAVVELLASSSSAWLMREAFARSAADPAAPARRRPSSTCAKWVGCAQLTM